MKQFLRLLPLVPVFGTIGYYIAQHGVILLPVVF